MGAQRKTNLGANDLIFFSIRLLETVSTAPGRRVPATSLMMEFDIDDAQLDHIISAVCSLSDSVTGARPNVYRDQDDVVIQGDAGDVDPIRLSAASSALMETLLARGALDERETAHIKTALATTHQENGIKPVRSTEYYGPFHYTLSRAIEEGRRCIISYRSAGEQAPRTRTIDPCEIFTEHGNAYLIAWDVEQDEQRCYRLDRIHEACATAVESTPHQLDRSPIGAHLLKTGEKADLRFSEASYFNRLHWEGVRFLEPDPRAPVQTLDVSVSYSNEAWLFDQVLAGGGCIIILSPNDLRERFLSYAQALLAEQPGPPAPPA